MPTYLVKHYLWKCLWGCFWKRIAFESVDWVKPITPQCARAPSLSFRTWVEPTGGGRSSLSGWLLELGSCLLPWDQNVHHWWSWLSGLQTQTGTTPPVFLGLQFANGRTWDLPVYIIVSQFLIIHSCLDYVCNIEYAYIHTHA